MDNRLTKQEVIDWIDFLYKDLLTYRIFIGGYFFTFKQLNDIKCKINTMERTISRLNDEMNMNTLKRGVQVLKGVLDTLDLTKAETKKMLDFVTSKVSVTNEFGETLVLPVTYDELKYVYERLSYCKDEVDFFSNFLLEEIQQVKEEDLNDFFIFINDYLAEVKENLKSEKPMVKVIVKKPNTAKDKVAKKSV